MPIPDFQSLMLPALKALSDGEEKPISEIRNHIAEAQGLTPEEMRELLPSGRQPVFVNRVSWALLYLGRAGLSERVRRGVWRLTAEGERLLADAPPRIDMNYLRNYPAYVAWRTGKNTSSSSEDAVLIPPDDSANTPEEELDRVVQQLRYELEADVLNRVRDRAASVSRTGGGGPVSRDGLWRW